MHRYALTRLFEEQPEAFVRPLIAPALSTWSPGEFPPPLAGVRRFSVEWTPIRGGEPESLVALRIEWQTEELRRRCHHLDSELDAIRSTVTLLSEHTTELAAYAVALCALGVVLPGRRVESFNPGQTPDLLLSPAGDVGVEVAGRSSGGLAALKRLAAPNRNGRSNAERAGKRDWLRRSEHLTSAYLSLWRSTRSKD